MRKVIATLWIHNWYIFQGIEDGKVVVEDWWLTDGVEHLEAADVASLKTTTFKYRDFFQRV